MALSILTVAHPFAPVGPEAAGETEQAVAALDAALVRAGHRSLVLAPEGSQVAGTLIPLPRVQGPVDEARRLGIDARLRTVLAETLNRTPVDIVHMHGAGFHHHLPPPGVPTLVTLHLPLDRYPPAALTPGRPETWLHGVSAAQHRAAPPGLHLLPPIESGISVEKLWIRVPKRRFAVALGPIRPEKGFHLALDAAALADMQALLAGETCGSPGQETYFREEIQPRLDGRRRFLGAVGFARKRWMLGSARCLLAPSLTAETSSLVAMEALACGTPVVAFPAGALADLVEPGVTGFLVNDVQEMADAIAEAERIDPEACRATARTHHSVERMTGRYLALYEDLVAGEGRVLVVA